MMYFPFLSGLATGMTLIVAIGAQNVFILRQGCRREHIGTTVLICLLSDVVLILAGVAGFGALLALAPWFTSVARIGGAGFLVVYSFFAARRALSASSMDAQTTTAAIPQRTAALTALALTWLNPHVYLDTVVLLGSIAASQGNTGRWIFGAGAVLASTVWFFCLGFGARYLQRFFTNPKSWRVLDASVAILMLILAASLVVPVFA